MLEGDIFAEDDDEEDQANFFNNDGDEYTAGMFPD